MLEPHFRALGNCLCMLVFILSIFGTIGALLWLALINLTVSYVLIALTIFGALYYDEYSRCRKNPNRKLWRGE